MALTDLTPTERQTSFGQIQKNSSVSGNPLKIKGKTYPTGWGIHANGKLLFTIPDGYKRFVMTAGLDDFHQNDTRRSVQIHLWTRSKAGEEKLLDESPILCAQTVSLWYFNQKLPEDASQLRIEISDAKDGIACDHVDIVQGGFLKE